MIEKYYGFMEEFISYFNCYQGHNLMRVLILMILPQ